MYGSRFDTMMTSAPGKRIVEQIVKGLRRPLDLSCFSRRAADFQILEQLVYLAIYPGAIRAWSNHRPARADISQRAAQGRHPAAKEEEREDGRDAGHHGRGSDKRRHDQRLRLSGARRDEGQVVEDGEVVGPARSLHGKGSHQDPAILIRDTGETLAAGPRGLLAREAGRHQSRCAQQLAGRIAQADREDAFVFGHALKNACEALAVIVRKRACDRPLDRGVGKAGAQFDITLQPSFDERARERHGREGENSQQPERQRSVDEQTIVELPSP